MNPIALAYSQEPPFQIIYEFQAPVTKLKQPFVEIFTTGWAMVNSNTVNSKGI